MASEKVQEPLFGCSSKEYKMHYSLPKTKFADKRDHLTTGRTTDTSPYRAYTVDESLDLSSCLEYIVFRRPRRAGVSL